MSISTITAGALGEKAACELLQKQGYKILERNFRTRYGEIDIIALDFSNKLETLVFVEVKTRWNLDYGYPEEAVTPRKLRLVAQAAQFYKLTHPKTPDLLRIDVVAIEVEGDRVVATRLIRNVTG
ncbi:MAG: hypothetical protein A3A77_01460 [Candidatus Blackburnbacteria bacterium RIFCSPLOWO2_01_FULL_40_20]|uniref:UPF0102 protein A3A77_01460 n=1 Tax=Candidatus Blackburnbacteria bacterium RIFCSPLOWO2_01_FULL_40_20 TaxID=1797519 RepID=A0A1G1VCM6_9BACT|nr:MAG: hypothetical protein A3A77_01460 [Candidatus Blackburnbacteria bacterium RIFCSPLOWO2_01_FULL_40_20]